jgi:ATP-dependent Clp protease ATP-binding subunit ClpB
MDAEKLTLKSREAVASAQAIASQYGHTEVDAEHLLAALLRQEGGLAPRLFEKMGVPLEPLAQRLERELERRPRVSGPGR